MKLSLFLKDVDESARNAVGGKGFALARMEGEGFPVPKALCVTTEAYRRYMEATGLGERIGLELHRKDFRDMRWEEIWDAALRIRNLFLGAPIPPDLGRALREPIQGFFNDAAVVVRSSAPGEDSARTSFAGLHESYVNVRGPDAVLEHIVKVWASLWSDAALLYRQELGLDFEKSTMGVVVQEIVVGERSGVAFSRNPNNPEEAVVEAVYGLNQGLVDGTVEPDRWTVDRTTGRITSHVAAQRDQQVFPAPGGIGLEALTAEQSERAPLGNEDVAGVFDLVMKAEGFFGSPQDVEWTFQAGNLFVLQSRPVTTLGGGDPEGEDKRPWYLSLRRSFGNLKVLRRKIEEELIPAMIAAVEEPAGMDLEHITDDALADEITGRKGVYDRWLRVYRQDFIPFAHGFRLFGQVYNDALHPSDPYAFIDLLSDTGLVSVTRNSRLEELARMIRESPGLRGSLETGNHKADTDFSQGLGAFLKEFQDLSWGSTRFFQEEGVLVRFLLEMASSPPEKAKREKDAHALREKFLGRFQGEKRAEMAELLDLGRVSYRLRDDDNIYLGRIEGRMIASVNEGKRRIGERIGKEVDHLDPEAVISCLRNPEAVPEGPSDKKKEVQVQGLKPRQLVGQPAGPGLARGTARVIREASDVLKFKAGEILVCDSIDPNMTFVVPLSAGIVERRGGMLIHGAIVAREYGLPCVTGVPDAADLIHTGDSLTVDGYLGIVIIG